MNELYPLKFNPIIKDYLWGGSRLKEYLNKETGNNKRAAESWEISGVSDNIFVVNNGKLKGNNLQELTEIYMGDLVGDTVYEKFGIEFPLLIKFLDADNDARLISGFKGEAGRDIYLDHLNKKKLGEILNYEKVKKGDVFFIPAGRVHAIGEGILLTEIQQTSDITYRIYDWDRVDYKGNSRELHTELALDAIDFSPPDNYRTTYESKLNRSSSIIECPYFCTNIIVAGREIEKDYVNIDSFVIYICTEGSFSLEYASDKMKISKGETVLLPASLKEFRIVPDNKATILEIYIPGVV